MRGGVDVVWLPCDSIVSSCRWCHFLHVLTFYSELKEPSISDHVEFLKYAAPLRLELDHP